MTTHTGDQFSYVHVHRPHRQIFTSQIFPDFFFLSKCAAVFLEVHREEEEEGGRGQTGLFGQVTGDIPGEKGLKWMWDLAGVQTNVILRR